MYPISPLYSDYLRRPNREFLVKALIDGVEYDNSVIVDFTVENSISSIDGFELGTAIPSKLVISLRTKRIIPENAKIIPYLSLVLSGLTWEQATYPWEDMHITWEGGSSDWIPLGEFYVDSREKVNDVWTFTCYDKLVFSDVAYVSALSYPTSMQNVWDEICTSLGYTYDDSVVINQAYQVPVAPTGYTKRQVMGYIAGANAANVITGKDGTIRFQRFTSASIPVFEMKSSDYVRVKQTNPVKTFTRVVVTYNTEDQLTYEAGEGDENHTLNMENPLMNQTMTNNLINELDGFSYLPVTMDARGFPQFEQGDIISFEQYEGVTWEDATIAWQNMNIPWNGLVSYRTVILRQTFSFAGGLRMSIEAPSISDQQSEFKVDGTLTTAVNNLNKTAVKEGKSYYGATITRTEGLIIEREDHLSKAVFNSDELTFYAEGERALWFDVPKRKFIFGGDLEAAGGTFSGTLQAVDGVFTGTLQGADGTFTGTLSAGRVEGGTIIGSFIQGADMLGGRIRTATSGNRIELDPDGFRFYDDFGGLRVALGFNPSAGISGHTYYNSSGSPQGLIYATSDELHVIGNNNLRVGTNFGLTYAQGTWKFTGVVDFSDATVIMP